MEPQDDYLPEALLGRLVDYETATVISQMIHPPRPVLLVNGDKPRPGMDISLVPVTYIRQPEYWEIRVVGTPGEVGGPPEATQLPAEPPVPTPLPAEPPVPTQLPAEPLPAETTAYSVQLDLAGYTGTLGVEVVGANQTERILVPGSDTAEE